jgi:hypothetical protein
VPLLFAATLFVSASLLFMIQPMVAKMVLPLLGGSPAVWNACMVFFQALLLLGYLYAHHVAGKYEPKKQWAIHLVVLGLPIGAFLLAVAFGARHSPIAIAESLAPSGDSSPVLSVLALLAVAIAIPFFVISTSAPLLQKWFAYTGHPSARDPYFLYSASNFGSMISLLGYPLVIEPNMTIVGQAWLFAVGFGVLAVMIYFCGQAAANPIGVPPPAAARGKQKGKGQHAAGEPALPPTTEPPPSWGRKLKWIVLAFVPSSLMLGVTFHMSTDIASIPLMWVIPLALYLVTFIIAFGRVPDWFRLVIGNLAPVMILLLIFVLISGVSPGMGIELMLHIVTFFAVALMCHYELARDRPSPQYLTEFFLLMSVGGMLGGVFNSLIAPMVFVHAYEYKLVLVIACLLVPRLVDEKAEQELGPRSPQRRRIALAFDIIIPLLIGVAFYYVSRMPYDSEWYVRTRLNLHERLHLSQETIEAILLFAVPVMVCFFFVDRPLRFALCAAAILGPITIREATRTAIHTERSFFGILKVEDFPGGKPLRHGDSVIRDSEGKVLVAERYKLRRLVHGTTLHGTQIVEHERHILDDFQMVMPGLIPWDAVAITGTIHAYEMREQPLTYYHRTGPVGAMFRELYMRKGGADAKADFGMVGLGTGSVSCYAFPGQRLTFYEIDPAVKKLVADTDQYFTYYQDAVRRGALMDIRMGDARLKLKEDTDRKFALLLVDAFSSDAIPVHLLTREAVQLYLDRLTDDGILALHISNKYVKLEPVCAQIAADLGLVARLWSDGGEKGLGKTASSWVVLARKDAHLGTLALPLEKQKEFGTEFVPLRVHKPMPAWTDDYSDVMRVMMIKEVVTLRRFFGLPTYKDDDE